jgi:Uma2 family endonuclease
METEVSKWLINVDEYYKMAEVGILKPDDRLELINGEIFKMSPIGSKHAAIVDRLARILNHLLQSEVIIRVQNPLSFDINSEPEPDISILKYKSDDYASGHPVAADVLAIIEVAGSSIRFDKEVKAPLYALHSIPEYWIIDLENNRIEVHSKPVEGIYTETQFCLPGDEVILMDKKLSVNELLILG